MGIGVAVVGLGFGAEFLPIYLSHPSVGYVAIADSDPLRLAEVGNTVRSREPVLEPRRGAG